MEGTSKKVKNTLNVGMGEIVTTSSPNVLSSLGLGSCIALVLYDPVEKIAGMAHIMLPDSSMRSKSCNNTKPGKYADNAVDALINELDSKGASRKRIKAKVAGGSKMFSFEISALLSIGEQNVKKVLDLLDSHSIPLEGCDTGGSRGRSVRFNILECILEVKIIGQGIKAI